MTKEQAFFLKTLSDNMFGKQTKTEEFEGIEISKLFNIAHAHKMTELVYSQNRDFFKNNSDYKEFFYKFEKHYGMMMYTVTNRNSTCKSILKKFEKANITFFIFKGMEIAKYYNSPVFRTFSDVDVMMSSEDREKAHELMLKNDFLCKSQGEHEWCYHKGNVAFELHDSMFFKETFNPPECIEFCNHCWEYTKDTNNSSRKELDLSFHFIYLLLHLRKHMLFQGVGFRQFYDLAVLAEYKRSDINWNWIEESLDSINLLHFGRMCMAMCQRWFMVSSPMGEIEVDEDFYVQATEKIFKNGVFGARNSDNDISNVGNKINSYNTSSSIGVFLHMISSAFPSYKDMKNAKAYQKLDGKPFLLPVFWVYRWCRIILRKDTPKVNKIFVPIKEKDKLTARNIELEKWGL